MADTTEILIELAQWRAGFGDGCPHRGDDGCCQHDKNTTPECHLWACPLPRPWDLLVTCGKLADSRYRAIRNLQRIRKSLTNITPLSALDGPLWSAVGYLFGLGSTFAIELCREAGVDPHENNDLAAAEGPRVEALRSHLDKWWKP